MDEILLHTHQKKKKNFNGKSLLSVLHCIERDKHVSISNHVEVLKHLVLTKSNVPTSTFSPNLFRVHLASATIQNIVKNMNLRTWTILFLLSPKSHVKLIMHVPGGLKRARKQAMLFTNQKDKRKAIYLSNMCKIVLWLHWKKERKEKKINHVLCALNCLVFVWKSMGTLPHLTVKIIYQISRWRLWLAPPI